MTRTKQLAVVLAGVCCTSTLFFGVISASAATVSSVAAYKAATDPNPPLPLTPAQQQILDKKIQAAEALLSGTASTATAGTSAAAISASLSAASTASGSAALTENQHPQIYDHYCGPASVVEALGQMGHWFTQDTMAAQLGTTSAGTGWVSGSSGPVQNVLNNHVTRNDYFGSIVPGSPSSTDINAYKLGLIVDVGIVIAPLIGDAWETSQSTYHLKYHPTDRTIFHWFDIYGYTSGGDNTTYEDSVYGATSVSWHTSVTHPYATIPSSKIVAIVGGRGYVW